MTDEPADNMLDVIAAYLAGQDQAERELGARFGLEHGVPLDFELLVSPDVGLKLAEANGGPHERVHISWMLEPGTCYIVARGGLDPRSWGRGLG